MIVFFSAAVCRFLLVCRRYKYAYYKVYHQAAPNAYSRVCVMRLWSVNTDERHRMYVLFSDPQSAASGAAYGGSSRQVEMV
jgi:hypothetical protein